MIAEFFCFSQDGKYYAIDTTRVIPVQLSMEAYRILTEIQKQQTDIPEMDAFEGMKGIEDIHALVSQNVLLHEKHYLVKNSFRELNISLIPTLGCNLDCKYCYSSRKKEQKKTPITIVQDAFKFFCNQYPFSYCRIDFVSGGEPLYDEEYLKEVIETITDIMDIYGKKTLFWLCTNGLLLNDSIVQYLDSKHFNIGISLDGPEDVNDSNRRDQSGRGTYKCIEKKIAEVYNNPKLSRNIKNLWNCAVITSDTKSLVDIMSNSYDLGFRNIQMKLVWNNDNSIRLSEERAIGLYRDLTQYLFELVQEEKYDQFLCICNENDTYGKVLLRIIIQSGTVRRCNAGVNKFSISPEGELYPCDSFLGIKKFCIGNIYDGFNERYKEFRFKRNETISKCSTCWAMYICGGDCYYHSYINNGDPWLPDEKMCIIMKEIVKMCTVLVIDLYSAFPERMEKIYSILSKKVIQMEPK